MGKDGSCREGYFEGVERTPTLLGKVPRGVLSGEPSEGNHDIGVIVNELMVEVGEAQEGLDILYPSGLRPVADGLDFFLGPLSVQRVRDSTRGTPQIPSGTHIFRVWHISRAFADSEALPERVFGDPPYCPNILGCR